jgi:hypothetical protein
MDWSNALAYAEGSTLAGYTDWRLPNAKELQSLLDYTRSPGKTASAAISSLFSATQITNMADEVDYPWYWSGTTHLTYSGSAARGVYVCFGRGTGSMDGGTNIIDVHGAGCQRSDPKSGDPGDYPQAGNGPQGDVQRVFNHVRIVRDLAPIADYDDDGLTDADERGGYGTSPYDPDTDADGALDGSEVAAGMDPNDEHSLFALFDVTLSDTNVVIKWYSASNRTYTVRGASNLLSNAWWFVEGGITGTPPINAYTTTPTSVTAGFYRVEVE